MNYNADEKGSPICAPKPVRTPGHNNKVTDCSEVHPNFLPFLRPGLRKKLYFRRLVKAQIRMSPRFLTKFENKLTRKNEATEYWSKPPPKLGALGAAAKKRARRLRRLGCEPPPRIITLEEALRAA